MKATLTADLKRQLGSLLKIIIRITIIYPEKLHTLHSGSHEPTEGRGLGWSGHLYSKLTGPLNPRDTGGGGVEDILSSDPLSDLNFHLCLLLQYQF